jgi:very-short-patch-repair endonuclease
MVVFIIKLQRCRLDIDPPNTHPKPTTMNDQSNTCLHCNTAINETDSKYSIENCGLSLCMVCQNWFWQTIRNTTATKETINLYLLLKQKDLHVELEKYDGHKTTPITATDARVNIEVDGSQHNSDPFVALSDLQNTCSDFRNGYLTLRIPKTLIKKHLRETAYYIFQFLLLRKQNLSR